MKSARVATSWEDLRAFGSGSWEGWLDRCKIATGWGHAFGARPLAEGRKGIIEDVALLVGIWVREKVLFDMVRSRGLQECCEKIHFVGTCRGESSSVSGSEWAMARAWAGVGNEGGGTPFGAAAQVAQGLEDRMLEIGMGGRYEDTGRLWEGRRTQDG